ncbi:MAG: hypothetical protein M3362_27870, partial [Acidobacteriota bacterium]|nr:hypothetical protein [Acidobacteriota bacterium]
MRKPTKSKGNKRDKTALDVADLITQKEAALIRAVTTAAIGDLIKRGRLRTAEMFGRVLVYRSDVEDFKPEK